MPKVDWGRFKWQLRLDEHWQDYDDQEDLVLKQAYEKGQNVVRYDTRGQTYEVSFKSMTQLNIETKKVRRVRHKNVAHPLRKGKGGGKGGTAPGKGPAKAPGAATMEGAKKPPPKKGCCPCCAGCCGPKGICACLVALPIIGAIVIMIVGGGIPDSAEEFGEMALETGDAIMDGFEDAGEAIADLADHIVD